MEYFRARRLEEVEPFTIIGGNALVLRFREGGRLVVLHAIVATGVNNAGHGKFLACNYPSLKMALASWVLRHMGACVSAYHLVCKRTRSDARVGMVAMIGARRLALPDKDSASTTQ